MDHAKWFDVLTSLPVSRSILPRVVCFATSRPANHVICSFIDSSGYAAGPIRICLFIDYIINRFKPSSKIFYWPFHGGTSFVDLLFFFLACVCYVFVRVCLFVLCCHLLGKGWPLGSRLWRLAVSLSLSHWYPGSGVVLDCIDSWSLHPYLLLIYLKWAVTWDFYNVVYATSLTRAFTSRLNII